MYMNQKLPYYMAYPMPAAFDEGRRDRLDFEYMKSMYPDIPRKILPYIEEECDRMEYDNSMVYDEYPDRLQLRMMCRRVGRRVEENEKIVFPRSCSACGYDPDEQKSGNERQMLSDLIEVMLYQELYRRRCDRRRKCRRIY